MDVLIKSFGLLIRLFTTREHQAYLKADSYALTHSLGLSKNRTTSTPELSEKAQFKFKWGRKKVCCQSLPDLLETDCLIKDLSSLISFRQSPVKTGSCVFSAWSVLFLYRYMTLNPQIDLLRIFKVLKGSFFVCARLIAVTFVNLLVRPPVPVLCMCASKSMPALWHTTCVLQNANPYIELWFSAQWL